MSSSISYIFIGYYTVQSLPGTILLERDELCEDLKVQRTDRKKGSFPFVRFSMLCTPNKSQT